MRTFTIQNKTIKPGIVVAEGYRKRYNEEGAAEERIPTTFTMLGRASRGDKDGFFRKVNLNLKNPPEISKGNIGDGFILARESPRGQAFFLWCKANKPSDDRFLARINTALIPQRGDGTIQEEAGKPVCVVDGAVHDDGVSTASDEIWCMHRGDALRISFQGEAGDWILQYSEQEGLRLFRERNSVHEHENFAKLGETVAVADPE